MSSESEFRPKIPQDIVLSWVACYCTALMSEIWTLFNPINKIYEAISFEKRGRKFKMCGTRERWVDLNMIRSVCVGM